MSRTDLAADAAGFDDKERENLSMSNGESTNDFGGVGLPLEDKGWLSPPDSICSSSTDSGITSTEMSLPGSCNDQEDIKQQLLHGTNSRGAIDFQTTTPCSPADCQEMLDSLHISKYTEADNTHIGSFKSTPTPSDVNGYPLALALPRNEPVRVCPDTSGHPNENIEVVVSGGKDEIPPLNKIMVKDETRDVTHVSSRVGRGKHANPIKYFTCTVFNFLFLFSVYICCFYLALLTKSASLGTSFHTFLFYILFIVFFILFIL